MSTRVFLWGMMGVGKTTIGKKLANQLEMSFADTDDLVEKQTGLSVEEIFKTQGEEAFRVLERQVLDDVLSMENIVLATGGGLPCFGTNAQSMLTSGICIYLKASTKFMEQRTNQSSHSRPLLKDAQSLEDRLNVLSEILNQRSAFYETAHLTVNAVDLKASDLAILIKSSGQ